jgi:hypothetical protein
MEDNPDQFPEASTDSVIRKIKQGASAYSSLQDYVIDLMKKLDTNGDGFLSQEEWDAKRREHKCGSKSEG